MEPGSSLPHSQVPSTCPYPEPTRSIPYPHIPFPEEILIYINFKIFKNILVEKIKHSLFVVNC
jgi:hypothetical protein